jgi:hypothetical protein
MIATVPRAKWADIEPGRRDVFPARLSGRNLIVLDRYCVPATAATRYPGAYPVVQLDGDRILMPAASMFDPRNVADTQPVTTSSFADPVRAPSYLELTAIGPGAGDALSAIERHIGATIPTETACAAAGELEYVRILLRCNARERPQIEAALVSANRRPEDAAPLPGRPELCVRVKGYALLPAAAIREAPFELVRYLRDYSGELRRHEAERAIRESASRDKANVPPATARRLRYALQIFHAGSMLQFAAGAIVAEPEIIRAIQATDAAAIIPIDGETRPKDLKPGEIRYKGRFFATVYGLGLIDAKEGHVVTGTDPHYVQRLRASGASIEVYGEEDAPTPAPPTPSRKTVAA